MSTIEPVNPVLELIREGRVERTFEVLGPDLHLGRLSGLEVQFEDTRVSRQHARVERRPDGSCVLVDLGSKSFTLLNGRRLLPFHPAPLRDGYRIRIVEHELIFRDKSVRFRESVEDSSTVLEARGDLTTVGLAQRSEMPAIAFQAVLEVNRALGGGTALSEAMGRALQGLMTVFSSAERSFVVAAEPDGTFPLLAVQYRQGGGVQPEVSRTILRRVVSEATAVLISDALIDPRFMEHQSVATTLRTALCVPLPDHDGRPIGMVQLDSQSLARGFTAADLDLLAALAVPMGVAVENHRLLTTQASWAAAGDIQLSLLPKLQPDLAGYAFWQCYRPALEVGGDLYDYIPVGTTGKGAGPDRPGRWAVSLGDVSGKGMPAALMMAGTCPEVRQLVREGLDPREVVSRVNRGVHERGVDNRFVTLLLIEIDPETHQLTLAIAGHMPPIVVRADGLIEELSDELAGMPLGVDPDEVYESITTTIGPGDVVVLYSDGVIDAFDTGGQRFGRESLLRVLGEAHRGAAATGEAVLAAVRAHAAGRSQFDDITIVCFGRQSGD